jgi:branched-subunit amino acid ABC-type transport system permease component
VQNILFGLIAGSVLAVATSGFALLRNTERFLHIAHGQFMALGAFLGIILAGPLGVLPAMVASVLLVSALGVLSGILLFDPVKEQGGNVMLFTSVGLAFVIYAVMIAVFGTQLRVYDVQLGDARDIGPVSIAPGEIVLLLLAALVMTGLWLLLSKTSIGRDIRAVASNRELAQIRGVAIKRVTRTVWALSSALAAIGGIMMGVLGSVTTELGWTNILLILAAAVLGGMGNILGVIGAALALGIVMDVSALVIDTSYRPIVAFTILILVLLVKPEGLVSFQKRSEVTA